MGQLRFLNPTKEERYEMYSHGCTGFHCLSGLGAGNSNF